MIIMINSSCVASGKTFAVDFNDWKILFHEIPEKLKELDNRGWCLICDIMS